MNVISSKKREKKKLNATKHLIYLSPSSYQNEICSKVCYCICWLGTDLVFLPGLEKTLNALWHFRLCGMTFRIHPAAFHRVPPHSGVVIRFLCLQYFWRRFNPGSFSLAVFNLLNDWLRLSEISSLSKASTWQETTEQHQKSDQCFPSYRRIAGPVMLACYRGSPDTLSSQSSSVSVLTRSAPTKHITSLSWPGEGGGRTLRSGQLQSSPAPFSQTGGEFYAST